MPKFAIIDPLQQLHMPAFITAMTGMDALTQAIESYVSLNANPFSDAYGEMAIRLIGENIRTALHDPLNLEAREKMAVASTLAGLGFCVVRRERLCEICVCGAPTKPIPENKSTPLPKKFPPI